MSARLRPIRLTMKRALARHYPEYLMEAFGLGAFMLAACLCGALLGHPASPAVQALPDPFVRQALAGLAMGLTAVAILYSPWAKRSGGHINPSVTLTFLRLGRIEGWDAAFYVLAQFLGGLAGVLLAWALLGSALVHPAVHFGVTAPGPYGAQVAAAGELLISFLMMSMVLMASNSRLSGLTPLFAGLLVALFITFEGPLSGMSMNPARTFASALPAGDWTAAWVYFLVPPAGMLAAAELHLRLGKAVACAKLHHGKAQRCIFCGAGEVPRTL